MHDHVTLLNRSKRIHAISLSPRHDNDRHDSPSPDSTANNLFTTLSTPNTIIHALFTVAISTFVIMLVTTPPKPFITHRNKGCQSPKYNRHHHRPLFTPKSTAPTICDPPSPLRNPPLFPLSTNIPDSDDMTFSPFNKSPPLVPPLNALFIIQPQTISVDDEEGNIFLSTAASPPQLPLTPLKYPRRVPSRTLLSAGQQSTVASLAGDGASRGAAGMKRKSTCSTTSLRQQNLTPLRSSQSAKLNDSGISFDRLAPLLAPKFGANTPQSKAETDAHLRCQTDTLTRLRLSDPEVVDFDDAANDSGCEGSAHLSPTMRKHPKSLTIDSVHRSKAFEEVAEAISPGGHVTKRRARSRPVSFELLEGIIKPPEKSPLKVRKYFHSSCWSNCHCDIVYQANWHSLSHRRIPA